jgi:hypothetical protein
MHDKQSENDPNTVLYFPAIQSVQLPKALLYFPALHSVQIVAPYEDEYVPGGQN